MKKISLLLILLFTMLSTEARVWYVLRLGNGDGTSPSTPSRDLQDVINRAAAADEIRIGTGAIAPMRPANNLNIIDYDNRDNAFVITKPLTLKGGYSDDFSSRTNTKSIIGFTSYLLYEPKYHSVIISGADNVVLDGLQICGGQANGSGNIVINGNEIYRNCGGGLYVVKSAPRLENVTITNNLASNSGGGVYIESRYPNVRVMMTNVEISNNTASRGGGACFNQSEQELTNVTIKKNHATLDGGGIFLYWAYYSKMKNLKIINNSSDAYGGGISAVISFDSYWETIEISNNTAGSDGGGAYTYGCYGIDFVNATICNNSASRGGGIACDTEGNLKNSIVWDNTATSTAEKNIYLISGEYYNKLNYYYSLVQGITTEVNGNLNGTTITSPGFVNAANGNYRLSENPLSPCIGKGNNAYVTTTTDLDGNWRRRGLNVDLGAYESANTTKSLSQQTDDYYDIILENDKNPEIELSVFPNPVNGNQKINISLGNYNKPIDVKLYSLNGKLVHNKTCEGGNFELSTLDLVPGMYMISIQTQAGETFTRKIVVNK